MRLRPPPLGAAMALGVALRALWIPLGSGDARFENVDTTAYRAFAGSLPGALGDPPPVALDPSLQRSPGYPLLMWLTGADDGSVVPLLLVQCLLGGVVAVGLVHLLAGRMAGPRVAAVAALVVALDPVSVAHSLLLGTETLFTVVLLGAVVLLWRAGEEAAAGRAGWPWLTGGGAALGAGSLVRPQLVYLVPLGAAGAATLVAARLVGGRGRGRVGVGALLVVLLSATVVGGPWLVRNRIVAERWLVSTAQGQNLADIGAACMDAEASGVAWWPEADEASFARQDRARARFEARYGRAVELADVVARDEAWGRAGRDAIEAHPRGCAMVLGASLVRGVAGPGDALLVTLAGPEPPAALRAAVRLGSVVAVLGQVGLGVVGLVVLARRRAWAVAATLLVPIVAYLGTSAGPQLYARFRVPVVPYLAVLVAVGTVALWDRRAGRVSRRR